jgi:hypothetical protein
LVRRNRYGARSSASAKVNRNDMPTTKKTTRKVAKRAGQRTLSASHKRALAEGRTLSATVDRYLAAVNTPKRRGRKVSQATSTQRLSDAQTRLNSATGVEKVLAAQEVRDLKARLTQMNAGAGADVKQLEAAFVKIAKTFGENRGIGYGAWRDAGVSAVVLKRAGVARTRG